MSRLSLLVVAMLSVPAVGQAAIVYYPSPVPSPECQAAPQIAPYYQRQLEVLNHPYRAVYAPAEMPDYTCPRPTVDMLRHARPAAPLYYRKADLMPRVEYRRTTAAPAERGTILIIPQRLLDRPLSSFGPQKTA